MADYVGSRISLISNAEIRYEGVLYTVDVNEATVTLSNVKSYGTEDRPTDRHVPPRDEVYAYIIFRGSDIKNVKLVSPFPDDPAIVHHSAPPSMPPPTLPPPPPPPGPIGTGVALKLPFNQPPPGQMSHAVAPPMPPMSAPPPSVPPPVVTSSQQAPIPSPRSGWDVSLLPGGYPPTSNAGGLHGQVQLPDGPFHQTPVMQPPMTREQPSQVNQQSHAPQPPPRSTFSAAVGAPKTVDSRSEGTAQPEKSARKAQETRDQQNVAHARNKSREEGAQRSKVGDESKAQGHRPKQQPPPLIADEPAPQPRVEHNRQGHDSRRQMDRRFSGGGGYPRQDGQGYRHDGQGYRNDGQGYRQHDGQGYRQDGQGYPRGGGQMQGGYGNRGGMHYRGRGRGRGGLIGHLEPARLESRIKFTDEFDFETANAEFENVKSKLADLSIGSNGPADTGSVENGEVAVEPVNEVLDTSKDGEAEESKVFYNKERSFFDNISCEASERKAGAGKPDWKNERKLNVETFGVSSVRRPGGYYNRGYRRGGMGGGGYGYRGGSNTNGRYYGGGNNNDGGRTGGGGGYYRGNRGGGNRQQGWGRGGNRQPMRQADDQ